MSSKPSTNFAILIFKNISFYLCVCKIIVFVRDHQIYCEPLKWIIWNYFAHCLGKWGFNSPQNDILKANKQLHIVSRIRRMSAWQHIPFSFFIVSKHPLKARRQLLNFLFFKKMNKSNFQMQDFPTNLSDQICKFL